MASAYLARGAERDDYAFLALDRLAQRRGELGADMVGRAPQRVGVQVRVSLGRAGARVP